MISLILCCNQSRSSLKRSRALHLLVHLTSLNKLAFDLSNKRNQHHKTTFYFQLHQLLSHSLLSLSPTLNLSNNQQQHQRQPNQMTLIFLQSFQEVNLPPLVALSFPL